MDKKRMTEFDLYNDIKNRCNGEIFVGVVGPVRTGKSTFIKRFMDLMVLANMEESPEKTRLQDELPQSGTGRTITTTEPKFIPKNAANIKLAEDVSVNIRMVDCVGYMVEGATGHMEEDMPRMVKTPWFEEEIPFVKAAEVGTRKVIRDHSTVGIVVTTDGSVTDLERSAYETAEKETIEELQSLHKPFIVLINTAKPYSEEAKHLADSIQSAYGVTAIPMNCQQMKKEDIRKVLENLLYEFPVSVMEFYMPKWVEMLENTHPFKAGLMDSIRELTKDIHCMRDVIEKPLTMDNEQVKHCVTEHIGMEDGVVRILLNLEDTCYYRMLSEWTQSEINSEYDLLRLLKEYTSMQKEYKKVQNAMDSVRHTGYGVVTPERTEIKLDKPEIIKHGSKYGVKIRAVSPSVHFIRANVITEIAPIVGSEQQAKDLIAYIGQSKEESDSIWDTNIFGKTVEQLVYDGISGKIAMIGEDSQQRLQETMQKIVNDSTGGFICIII